MLRELKQLRGADFEALDVSSLMRSPDSGKIRTGQANRLFLPGIWR
jgi:hypothetical protein